MKKTTALYNTHFWQWVISRSVGGALAGRFTDLGLSYFSIDATQRNKMTINCKYFAILF